MFIDGHRSSSAEAPTKAPAPLICDCWFGRVMLGDLCQNGYGSVWCDSYGFLWIPKDSYDSYSDIHGSFCDIMRVFCVYENMQIL
jgi:hypothetical protein